MCIEIQMAFAVLAGIFFFDLVCLDIIIRSYIDTFF